MSYLLYLYFFYNTCHNIVTLKKESTALACSDRKNHICIRVFLEEKGVIIFCFDTNSTYHVINTPVYPNSEADLCGMVCTSYTGDTIHGKYTTTCTAFTM